MIQWMGRWTLGAAIVIGQACSPTLPSCFLFHPCCLSNLTLDSFNPIFAVPKLQPS